MASVGREWGAKRAYKFWRHVTSGSVNRQIFGAATTVAGLTLVVKAAALGKELVVAARFGTGDVLDAYIMAALIPLLSVNVIAGSFSTALIPTFIRVREREGAGAAQTLLSEVSGYGVALLAASTALIAAAAPLYLPLIALGFGDDKLALTIRLTWVIAPVTLLSGVAHMWGAVLNAGERFAVVALAPVITPAVSVLFLLGARSWGIFALAAGMLSGAALETILLGAAMRRQGMPLRPRWRRPDAHLRQVGRQFYPPVAGNLLRSGSNVVARSMAAALPSGSVSALNYGNRTISALLNIVGTALGTALVPYFSKMVAGGDWRGLRSTLRRYLSLIFLVTVPAAVLFFLSAETITRALYERGSFTTADTRLVGRVLAFYALQIPFFVANVLMARTLFSLLRSHITLWAAAVNFLTNVVLNVVFVARFGAPGLALAASCASLVTFCFLAGCLFRVLKEQAGRNG